MLCPKSAIAPLFLLAAMAVSVSAQETPPPAAAALGPAWLGGPVRVSGLLDGYYLRNFNNPASGTNQLRNFDVKSNSMTLNMAKLVLEHDPAPVGFRVDFDSGGLFSCFTRRNREAIFWTSCLRRMYRSGRKRPEAAD